jgi:hypothetical protein
LTCCTRSTVFTGLFRAARRSEMSVGTFNASSSLARDCLGGCCVRKASVIACAYLATALGGGWGSAP